MLEKGKKFLNICLSTFLLLSIIFLFSVQNVKSRGRNGYDQSR